MFCRESLGTSEGKYYNYLLYKVQLGRVIIISFLRF